MTREQILQAVRGFAKDLLSLPDAQVIVADSAGTVPAGANPFITVNVLGSTTIDRQSPAVPGAVSGMVRRVSSQRRVRVSLNAYGATAEDWLTTMVVAWQSLHPDMDAVRAAGLTPGDASEPRPVPLTVDRYPSPRFQVDLFGYHRVILADQTVDTLDQVDVDQTLGGVTLPTYSITAA